ncbi:MAG: thioredoxin family protein, partial [Pseudomonadales bacterium]|nr:thioredoxin family protein [Pseudomonadales bacterium]
AAKLDDWKADSPVFVNFTAAWCITCKVNEAVALDRAAVREAFEAKGVRYLKGDWTSEDPLITAKLAEYGRSGVPLYLLYRKGESRATVLPQILTESVVLSAVEKLP